MLKSYRKEIFYFLLLLVNVILVVWQHFGMNHVFTLVPSSDIGIHMNNDDIDGGNSVATLTVEDGRARLDCETRRSETFAFCSIILPIGDSEKGSGLDLSNYHTLSLNLGFKSSLPDTVMIYLLNDEENEKGRITRFNQYTLQAKEGFHSYDLNIKLFNVPSWWLWQHSATQDDAAARIDNVTGINVSSGDNSLPRKLQLSVGRITLSGKWIEAKYLYLCLLVGWLLVISAHGLFTLRNLLDDFRLARQEAAKLEQLNQFLSIERDKYETMAKIDPLTQCLNRAGLRPLLQKQVADFAEKKLCSSMILIDVDHFKKINDQFGHDVGDKVLVALSAFLQNAIRSNDYLARWGGEEFIILSSYTDKAGALVFAEKLRKGIEETQLVEECWVTCSFGIAELRSEMVEPWFKAADEALYMAKGQGRNQVRAG